MLTLTRRIGEKTILTTASGERIEVTITERSADQVKLGIEAPKSVHVVREEIEGTPEKREAS